MDFVIDNFTFGVKHNVKNLFCNIHNSNQLFEHYDKNVIEKDIDTKYFYLYETCFDLTFSHWIFESAIYLIFFKECKKKYPELMLLVKKNPKRNYKQLIFDILNIKNEDIYWFENEDYNDCKSNYKNIPKNNVCIHTNPYYLNMKVFNIIQQQYFTTLVLNFKSKVLSNIKYANIKDNDFLLFKKSNKEVYTKANTSDNNIFNEVFSLIGGGEYIEHDPIETKHFYEQINLLLKSNNIFLPYGGALYVNGIFCKNSNIYIYGTVIEGQMQYDALKIILNIINESNNILYI
jgi:hypothetical protein